MTTEFNALADHRHAMAGPTAEAASSGTIACNVNNATGNTTTKISLHMEDLLSPLAKPNARSSSTAGPSPTEITVAETPSPHGDGGLSLLSPPTVHVKKLPDLDELVVAVSAVTETPTASDEKWTDVVTNRTPTMGSKFSTPASEKERAEVAFDDDVGGQKPFDESPSASPPKPFDEDFDDLSTSSSAAVSVSYRQKQTQPSSSNHHNHQHQPRPHRSQLVSQRQPHVQRRITYEEKRRSSGIGRHSEDNDAPDDEREPSIDNTLTKKGSRNHQDRKAQLNYVLSRMMQDVPASPERSQPQINKHLQHNHHRHPHHKYDDQEPSINRPNRMMVAPSPSFPPSMTAMALMAPTFSEQRNTTGASSLAMLASTIQPTMEPSADDEKLQKLQELSALISEAGEDDASVNLSAINYQVDRSTNSNTEAKHKKTILSTRSFDVNDDRSFMRPSTPPPAELSARTNRTYGPESPGTPPADLPSLSIQTSTPPPIRRGIPSTPGTSPILPATPSHMIDDDDSVYTDFIADVAVQQTILQKRKGCQVPAQARAMYDPYHPTDIKKTNSSGRSQTQQAVTAPHVVKNDDAVDSPNSDRSDEDDHKLTPKNLDFSTINKVANTILNESIDDFGEDNVKEIVDHLMQDIIVHKSTWEESVVENTPEDEPGQCLPPKWEDQDLGSVVSSDDDDIPFDCENDYSILLDGQDYNVDLERGFASLPEPQATRSRRNFSFRGMFRKAHHPWAQELDGVGNAVPDEVINSILLSQQQSASPAELIHTYRRRKCEAFEDEPLGSVALASGLNKSFETIDFMPKFPLESPTKKAKYFAKKKIYTEEPDDIPKGRSPLKVCLYACIILVFAACAILAGLYFSNSLVQFQTQTTETIADDAATNSSTVVSSGSNLFEGDQVMACHNALPLAEMDRTYYGSNWKAFKDDSLNGCGDMLSIGHAAWYSFTTPFSRLVEASTCNDADFDTKITVFSGSCGKLSCVTFNDEYCGHQSKVRWYAQRGTTYYVMIHGHRDASGTFGLTMKESHPYDDCYEAKPVKSGSVVVGTTSGSHSSTPPKCGDVDTSIPGVWYTLEGTSGFQSAELLKARNNIDGQVAVYRSMDEAGAGCGALLCDNGSADGQVSWLAESKHTYYVFVTGKNTTIDGEFRLFLGPDYTHYCEFSTKVDADTVGFLASTNSAIQQNVPSCGYSGYHAAPGVWFTIEGTGEVLAISTCGSEADLETEISVFSGGCGGLQCVGGTGEDLPCGPTGEVSWESVKGISYHIYISGRGNRKGDFVLNLSQRLRYDGYSCNASLPLDLTVPTVKSETTYAPSESINVCPGYKNVRGVWHSFVGTGKVVKLSACNQDTDFEAVVSVFTGDCDGLSCVAHTTTTCGPNDQVLVTTHVGLTYYVLVHGPNGFAVGKYRLMIEETAINDSCSEASEIVATSAKYHGSTLSAKVSTTETCSGVLEEATGLFYKVAGTGETYTFSTCNNITDFDTEITVYSGDDCSQLKCVANANDDDACGEQSTISFVSAANETYYVRVGGVNSTDHVGNFVLDVTVGRPFFNT